MAVEIANVVHALATCFGTLGEYIRRSGFSGAFNKTGTGVYVLTLIEPVGVSAEGNAGVFVTPNSPAIFSATIDAVDGSTITVRFLDAAGVATDVTKFDVMVMRMPVGLAIDP